MVPTKFCWKKIIILTEKYTDIDQNLQNFNVFGPYYTFLDVRSNNDFFFSILDI